MCIQLYLGSPPSVRAESVTLRGRSRRANRVKDSSVQALSAYTPAN